MYNKTQMLSAECERLTKALSEEKERLENLKALVKKAYKEGKSDGIGEGAPNFWRGNDWETSSARLKLQEILK